MASRTKPAAFRHGMTTETSGVRCGTADAMPDATTD
jgi:hypothetical protein